MAKGSAMESLVFMATGYARCRPNGKENGAGKKNSYPLRRAATWLAQANSRPIFRIKNNCFDLKGAHGP
ncbi:hypothetical protein GCM10011349_29060 [Novosphingobium indicum]|uniref:Uncharacterized protein n=1 Tax=Novosphingobium indicum TaxID=462949 RepID=A0ABQ2JSK5_9SPHN|nr:hypothetical protein [Novosphingobium indicum]GGN53934.1 hypothetical protein GCM10011349_29060 [Novosphingobium indicum]